MTHVDILRPHLPQALEVDAYASVHDMIHAAIIQHGSHATLRGVCFPS